MNKIYENGATYYLSDRELEDFKQSPYKKIRDWYNAEKKNPVHNNNESTPDLFLLT